MGLYENFKEVVGIIQKLDNIDLQRKILDIQAQALELFSANQEKDKKIKELEEKLNDSKAMKFSGQFYFIEGEEYPYCPGCWGKHKRKAHLVIDKGDASTTYRCPVSECKFEHYIDNPDYRPPKGPSCIY